MQDILHLLPVGKKARSRVGKGLQTAIVEQRHHDRMFVVFPGGYCCWLPLDGGDQFIIISEV